MEKADSSAQACEAELVARLRQGDTVALEQLYHLYFDRLYSLIFYQVGRNQSVAEDIVQKGKECVEEGANVVVVGCNGLAPLCTVSGVARVGKDEIPLIDCLAVGIKTAEMVVDINKELGLPFISRAGFYSLPRQKDVDRVRATFGL